MFCGEIIPRWSVGRAVCVPWYAWLLPPCAPLVKVFRRHRGQSVSGIFHESAGAVPARPAEEAARCDLGTLAGPDAVVARTAGSVVCELVGGIAVDEHPAA